MKLENRNANPTETLIAKVKKLNLKLGLQPVERNYLVLTSGFLSRTNKDSNTR